MLMGQRANPLLVIVGGRKEEVTMPLYMTQFAYTPEAWAALVDNPEDRSAPVRQLTEAMGGRVIGWYMSFGEYDGLVIYETLDNATAGAAALAAASRAHLRSYLLLNFGVLRETEVQLRSTRERRSSQNFPSTHSGEWASLQCSKRRGLKEGSSILYPQMEPLFAPVSLWGGPTSRGDCRPLGRILVPLVGCISLEASLRNAS
jgi:uncharacterized protein with GYD domain